MIQSSLGVTGSASVILSALVPAVDQATATAVLELPSFGTLTRDFLTRPPQEWAAERFEGFLRDTLTTYEYRFAPFGLEAARAGGRIIFPSFEHHPLGPNPKSIPEGWPTRRDVLIAALGNIQDANAINKLADPFWKGEGPADLQAIFVGSDFENLTWPSDISVADYYFPRGGVLGAGRLDLPVLLSEPLSSSIAPLQPMITGKVVDENSGELRDANFADNIIAVQTFITEKFLKSNPSGALAFYIPAPNPPGGADFQQDFQSFANAILSFDLETIAQEGGQQAVEEALQQFSGTFLEGTLDTDILGVPIIDASIRLDIDAERPEMPVCFLVDARLDPEGWLGQYIPQPAAQHAAGHEGEQPFVNFDFLIFPHPNQTNSRLFQLQLEINQTLRELTLRGVPTPEELSLAHAALVSQAVTEIHTMSLEDLRAEISAALPRIYGKLEGSDITVPFPGAPGSEMFVIEEALVEAYSPFYDLEGADGTTPWGRIQQDGGIGMRGTFDVLGGLVRADNAELVFYPDENFVPSIFGEFSATTSSIGGLETTGAVEVTFQSDSGGTLLTVDGELPNLNLGEFAQIYREENGKRTRIPISLDVAVEGGTWADATIEIGPGIFESPFIAPGTSVIAHGESTVDPFSFSLTDDWTASLSIVGDQVFELKVGNSVYATIRPNSAKPIADFSASISGNGTAFDSFTVENIPGGVVIETFPGLEKEDLRHQIFNIGAEASGSFSFDSDGNFMVSATIGAGRDLDVTGIGSAVAYDGGFTVRVSNNGLEFEGQSPPISIPLLGSIEPLNPADKLIDVTLKLTQSDGAVFVIDPARLELLAGGFDHSVNIHGLSISQPFSFSTSDPWDAKVTLQELTIPVSTSQDLLRIRRFNSNNPIASASLSGNGLQDFAFEFSTKLNLLVEVMPGAPGANPLKKSISVTGGFLTVGFNEGEGLYCSLPMTVPNFAFNPLLTIGQGAGGALSFDSGLLSMNLPNPNVSVLGINADLSFDGVSVSAGIDGSFGVEVINDSDINLFTIGTFDVLRMRAGSHSLSGNVLNPLGTMSLDFAGQLRYNQPRVNNNGAITADTQEHDFNISFGEDVTYTLSNSHFSDIEVSDFDVGWLRVTTGGDGKIRLGRQNGNFFVAFDDWDVFVFHDFYSNDNDVRFNNIDLALDTAGNFETGLDAFTFNLGSDSGRIRLATSEPMAFRWNILTAQIGLQLPDSASISLPGAGIDSGTLTTGISLPSNFPELGREGTFDKTFNHSVSMNGVDFGSIDVRFKRDTRDGPILFQIDGEAVPGYGGLDFDLSAGSNASFSAELSGSLEIPLGDCRPSLDPNDFNPWCPLANKNEGESDAKLDIADITLDFDNDAMSYQFKGSTSVLGGDVADVDLGTGGLRLTVLNIGVLKFGDEGLPGD